MLIVDHFEGEIAVIEYNGRTFNLPCSLLPAGAKEGDVLRISITVDKDQTAKRKKRIDILMNELFRD